MQLKSFTTNLTVILIVGFVIRVLFAFSYDTGDTGAFCNAGRLFLEQKEVYADPQVFFSGPPFALHVTALMQWIGNKVGLPCSGMWKMPSIFGDLGIGFLIYFIAKNEFKKSQQQAINMAMWYVYNPIAIFISGFQGQQEGFWLFFVILTWLLLKRYKKAVLAALCFGIALAYKIPAILLLPGLFFLINGWKSRFTFIGIVGCVFFLSVLPEIFTSRDALIRQSFLYSSIPGIWGISGIAQKILVLFPKAHEAGMKIVSTGLKGALGLSILWIYQDYFRHTQQNFFQIGLKVLIAFMILTPGFGTQYLVWLLPFFIMTESPLLSAYTGIVTFAYIHTYGLGIPPLDLILNILQRKIYYKTAIMYPYDLYYAVWMLLIALHLHKEHKLPKWLIKNNQTID